MDKCCQHCAHNNRAGARFCAGCGRNLELDCPQCGAGVPSSASFCDVCGANLTFAAGDNARRERNAAAEHLERRQLTVMFCDLVGWTSLSRQCDPEDLRPVIREFQSTCRQVISRYQGFISRYMGDGILTLFGYPQAHDDDACRAALASLDIVDAVTQIQHPAPSGSLTLSVRIGIATGLVIAGDVIGEAESRESAIVGETPNLAARLQGCANPNSIIVSQGTHRLIRERVTSRFAGARELKGYPELVRTYEVLGPSDNDTATAGPERQEPTPLVGRQGDVTLLKDFWAQAKDGTGRVIFVQGEAGIGKSRLIHELKRTIDPNAHHILECRCSPYFTNSALYPVVDLLRRILEITSGDSVDVIEDKLCAALSRCADIQEHVTELVSSLLLSNDPSSMAPMTQPSARPLMEIIDVLLKLALRRPVLLVIEDLHWVDPSTITLIGLLVDQVPLAKMLIVATARPEFQPAWLTRSHTSQITLRRLTSEDAIAMVASLKGDTDLPRSIDQRVAARADGVPLFVEELMQSLMDNSTSVQPESAIPETLRDSLMSRLDRMQSAKPVAQLASVIGRRFSFELLASVCEHSSDELLQKLNLLVESEVLYQSGVAPNSTYYFKHSLIRDVAYESLLNERRREYHLHIARTLERDREDITRTHPELVAHHYTIADEHQKAAEFWRRASEIALRQSANEEALNHARAGLEQAVQLRPSHERSQLMIALHAMQGASLSETKGYAVAEVAQAFNTALEISGNLQTRRELYPVYRGLHSYYLIRGPLSRARGLAAKLVDIATQENAYPVSEATRCLGWTRVCQGATNEGHALILRSISLYELAQPEEHIKHGISDTRSVALTNLAWTDWFLGRVDSAITRSQQAIDGALDIEHPFTLAYALCMGAAVHQCNNNPERVIALVEEALTLATKHAFQYWIGWGMSLQGWALTMLNEKQRGRAILNEGLTKYRATGARLFEPHILCMLAQCHVYQGDERDAADTLREAIQIEENAEVYLFSSETRRLLGEVMWALGEKEQASAHVERAVAIARRQQTISFELRAAQTKANMYEEDETARNDLAKVIARRDLANERETT